MVTLKPGDRVSCKLKESRIVGPYEDHDDIRQFEIIAAKAEYYSTNYHLFVPHYLTVKGTVKIDRFLIRDLKIHSKFLGEDAICIPEKQICNIKYIMSGLCCVVCGDFYEYAEPNQPDGALICFSCKQNPYR